MGLWLLVLLVLQTVWKGALGKNHSLHTRGLIELAGAISCGTGRNALAFLGYGCYCGLGGRGWPKDKVDWRESHIGAGATQVPCLHSMSVYYIKPTDDFGGTVYCNGVPLPDEINTSCCVSDDEHGFCSISHYLKVITWQSGKWQMHLKCHIGIYTVAWCCHKHDCCYDKAEREGCSPKTLRYEWTCEHNAVVCDKLTDRCQKMVCQCDQEAAKCWGIASYNPHYVLWPDFLCGQTTPTCHVI